MTLTGWRLGSKSLEALGTGSVSDRRDMNGMRTKLYPLMGRRKVRSGGNKLYLETLYTYKRPGVRVRLGHSVLSLMGTIVEWSGSIMNLLRRTSHYGYYGNRSGHTLPAQPAEQKGYRMSMDEGVSRDDSVQTPFVPTQADRDDPGEIKEELRKENAFICSILECQAHDGRIRFSDAVVAERLLGGEISRALTDLKPRHPSQLDEHLWTAAICILLERDFQSCAALWQLMVLKAKSYLGKFENSEELVRDVEEALRGLKLPIYTEQGGGVSEDNEASDFSSDIFFEYV
ncbi:hypothetical protein N656DRAFT_536923 [Canariomyces notabilis]|uniref:Uncharacterized protein n=1 Tax=Canariomyces notabilis TaxID=2074819 RepID=A0AAN6THL1_9PEZI|nr:hypothetical protein N656DRAFT_536923 [Canariomyces arenarius]